MSALLIIIMWNHQLDFGKNDMFIQDGSTVRQEAH